MKKIVRKFDEKSLVKELIVTSRLNFCSKISLPILTNIQRAEWTSSVEFNKAKYIPKDARQFQTYLRINNNSLVMASALTRMFLVEMGQSSSQWTEPRAVMKTTEGEPAVHSPLAKKCFPSASSSHPKRKKTAPQVSLRSLMHDPNDFEVPLDQSIPTPLPLFLSRLL